MLIFIITTIPTLDNILAYTAGSPESMAILMQKEGTYVGLEERAV